MEDIENVNLLTDVYGYFPSFHDAEVHRITLERSPSFRLPTLEADIHVFEMTAEVRDGVYVLRHHRLVTIQFFDVRELKLAGFNYQNVLGGLSITRSPGVLEGVLYDVVFEGVNGVAAQFECGPMRILSVRLFDPSD